MKTPRPLTSLAASLILLFVAFFTSAQSAGRDLRPEWLTYDGTSFVPATGDDKVIYLRIADNGMAEGHLVITGSDDLSLFVNHAVAGHSKSFRLSLDSLRSKFASSELLLAIYRPESRTIVQTTMEPAVAVPDDPYAPRPPSTFRDFVILSGLLLVIMALVIIRLNPKLAGDYFSIGGIFSVRETEESQTYARTGSSTNLLFYLYSSLLLGFYLIVIFHFVDGVYPIADRFDGDGFGSHLLGWLQLSGLIFLFFLLKIVVVYTVSYLFGLSEIAGAHFFNWVRILLVFLLSLSLVLFVYFIWHGQDADTHVVFYKLLAWLTALWIVLIFLKLARRGGASWFHLFSYICATEVIPFLLIVKVLYN